MKFNLKQLLGDQYKEGMSSEEIEKALATIDIPKNESSQKEIDRLTAALTKSNAEAAENKRKLHEKQTEEERANAEREEVLTALREEVASLKKDKLLAENKSQLLALGYDDALATETATAMADGDTAKIFANQKKFIEKQRSLIKADLMKNTPTPPAGAETDSMTKEKYRAMSLVEKQKLATENPTLYQKMNSEE